MTHIEKQIKRLEKELQEDRIERKVMIYQINMMN
jgi:hypothetical protein